MKLGRKFDVMVITPGDVELFRSYRQGEDGERIAFTYDDSLHFRLVRKQNTPLFDALTHIRQLPYTVSADVMSCFAYDVMLVDFGASQGMSHVACLLEGEGKAARENLRPLEDLNRCFRQQGFSISGIPGEEEPVHYVPFIASASMSREKEYLFVRRQYFDALMRALSLDMVCGDEEGRPQISGMPRPEMELRSFSRGLMDKLQVAPPKLSAYIGNAYSDGSSVAELTAARNAAAGHGPVRLSDMGPEDLMMGLDAGSTLCVPDFSGFDYGMERFPYSWHSERKSYVRRPLTGGEQHGPLNPGQQELAEFFAALSRRDMTGVEKLMGSLTPVEEESGDDALWQAWEQEVRTFLEDLPTQAEGLEALQGCRFPLPQAGCTPDDEGLRSNLSRYSFFLALAACKCWKADTYALEGKAERRLEDLVEGIRMLQDLPEDDAERRRARRKRRGDFLRRLTEGTGADSVIAACSMNRNGLQVLFPKGKQADKMGGQSAPGFVLPVRSAVLTDPAPGQRQLMELICALARGDAEAAAGMLGVQAERSDSLYRAWKDEVEAFFDEEQPLEAFTLADCAFPLPEVQDEAGRAGLAANLRRYAVLAAVAAVNPKRQTSFVPARSKGEGQRSAETLLQAIDGLRGKAADAVKAPMRRQDFVENLLGCPGPAGTYKPVRAIRTLNWTGRELQVYLTDVQEGVFLTRLSSPGHANCSDLYDGVGFMCGELFDRLQELLQGRPRRTDEEPLNAIQVRLPWIKGLLVRFDFAEFFADWAAAHGHGNRLTLYLEDLYGRHAPLFRQDENGVKPALKVLFTKSMFKGADWFRHLECGEGDADAMRWRAYWDRMAAHRTSFFVAGKNTPSGARSKLNYQFLSTSGLTLAELHTLARRQLDELLRAYTDEQALMDLLLAGQNDREEGGTAVDQALDAGIRSDESTQDTDVEKTQEESGDAAGAGESDADTEESEAAEDSAGRLIPLVDTNFYHRKLDSLVHSEVLQMMRGRLAVAGDVRFVIPDLMEMSLTIGRTCLRTKGKRSYQRVGEGQAEAAAFEAGVAKPAPGQKTPEMHGFYYAPGARSPWLQPDADLPGGVRRTCVATLRNPHYAAGEDPILAPVPAWEGYDRYFAQLTGCIMLPNATMCTINGADCDGDRVNVCAEELVLQAIRRQARADHALLDEVIRRQDDLADYLEQEAQENPEAGVYLRLLAAALGEILPGAPAADDFRMPGGAALCCAPLIFAGSGTKGASFTAKDLRQGASLRAKLFDAFQQAGQQQIGAMSLRVLELADKAYRADCPPASQCGERELAALFLQRYLVVISALDTALEIDMAKSGLERKDHPLKSPGEKEKACLGMAGGKSRFGIWRSLYLRHRRALDGDHFDARLALMMDEYSQKINTALMSGEELDVLLAGSGKLPERFGQLPLSLLPEMVYVLWQRAREQLPRGAYRQLRKALVTPDVAALLPDGALEAAQAEALEQLVQQASGMVQDYSARIARRSSLEQNHEKLNMRYLFILRWLLGQGCSLARTQELEMEIRGMLLDWRQQLGDEGCASALAYLSDRLTDEQLSAHWGWQSPEGRRDMMKALLRDAQQALRQEQRLQSAGRHYAAALMELVRQLEQEDWELWDWPGEESWRSALWQELTRLTGQRCDEDADVQSAAVLEMDTLARRARMNPDEALLAKLAALLAAVRTYVEDEDHGCPDVFNAAVTAVWQEMQDAQRCLEKADGAVLECPEGLMEVLGAHRRSIVLLKQIVRYGQMDVLMHGLGVPLQGVTTPMALRSELVRLVRRFMARQGWKQVHGMEDMLLYHVCHALNGLRVNVGNQRRAVMGDFLLVFMLGKDLRRRIAPAAESV